MLNIGWFSTGRDEAARQLLQVVQKSIHSGDIDGEIRFAFSNREPGESEESDLFFELVRSYDISLICFSHRKFKSRLLRFARNDKMRGGSDKTGGSNDKMGARGDETGSRNDSASAGEKENWRLKYDSEVAMRIEKFAPNLCVLAGYMLIIGKELCQKYNMINLHPALPNGPVGSWQEVIWKLIENKAEEAGAMMHLVTPELDRGPVVSYCLFSIKGEPFDRYWLKNDKTTLFELIRQYELAREFPLIILTLQALSQGKVSITDGKVLNAQGKPIDGYDLTEEINRAVENEIASL